MYNIKDNLYYGKSLHVSKKIIDNTNPYHYSVFCVWGISIFNQIRLRVKL